MAWGAPVAVLEVSIDGGRTWGDANLKAALSPYTWRLWRYRFEPAGNGSVDLVVRATDGSGAVQARRVTPPEYSGATGWDGVEVVEQSG